MLLAYRLVKQFNKVQILLAYTSAEPEQIALVQVDSLDQEALFINVHSNVWDLAHIPLHQLDTSPDPVIDLSSPVKTGKPYLLKNNTQSVLANSL